MISVSGVSDLSSEPRALLELAQSDPRKALEMGSTLIHRLPSGDHASRSTTLRALGIAARLGADMADSLDYGEQSVTEATKAGDGSLRSEALMSLAGSIAFSGDNLGAFRALDEAASAADSFLLAEIEFQRGTILGRMGEMTRARACYSRALPVFEDHDDRASIAMTLHNRAMVQISAGNLADAEGDLIRAREIDAQDQREVRVAGEEHGLGMVASLRGDIPLALAHFDESGRRFTELVGSASEIQVSRCEVLLSAGLFREALALATEIAADLHHAGLAEDEAEARLVGAQAALLAGRSDDALSWADRASEMFSEQGRTTWAAIARLTGIQVQHEAGVTDPLLLAEARMAAEILEREGHLPGAYRARLLAGMIGLRSGMDESVLDDLRRVAERSRGPIEAQLQSQLARAMIRMSEGDVRGADAAARAGMRLLDEYQAALGATDVRLGVERHGRDLGNLGLSFALDSRRARRVFRWMERRRGRALIYRPITPPADSKLAAELTELRQVTTELRGEGSPAAFALAERQQRLQQTIRDRARLTRGQGATAERLDPATIAGALGDHTLVEMAVLEGALWAVVIHNNRFRLRERAAEAEVTREAESLRFIMRRLARGRGSIAAAQEVANRLDELLFGRLRLTDGPLVIVPTPGLHAAPWWALPTCQERPVTISPSAELWFRAHRAGPGGKGALLAAGPDLELSDAEVSEIAGLYPNPTVFTSTESAVERIHANLDGAGVAHIASHALFQFENPMFSSLRLADGDLNVYDIERLGTAPDLVVLSACDSGFTHTHAGEELMGLSSALLSMGTRSIIASVGLVPDSAATRGLMVEFHRGLRSGLGPAQALHKAQAGLGDTPEGYVAASSFICIGAG
jgi:tetratricopeptide (TPR) repeat protein